MTSIYDIRIDQASANTTFALDAVMSCAHLCDMDSSEEILAALKAQGVKQGEIAKVLGVAQPNVSALYNPVKRTGKTRELSYDEGVKLVRAFNLDAGLPPLNEDGIASILNALLPLAPDEMSEKSAKALSQALIYGLERLQSLSANEASTRSLALASHDAVSRFLSALQQ